MKRSGLLAVMAECYTCGSKWESRNAAGVAARHANATGHHVVVEQVIGIIWNSPNEGS